MTRGRRMVITGIMAVVGAVVMVLLGVQVASNPEVQSNLGDQEFNVGNVHELAPEVKKGGPLLFQDLLQRDRDIYVSHTGAKPSTGWHAFEAHAPGQPRRCVLIWEAAERDLRDPCTGKRYPLTGKGLQTYEARVESNILVVDLRLS